MTVFKYAMRRGFNPVSVIANFFVPFSLLVFAQGLFDTNDLSGMNAWGFLLVALTIMVGMFYMAKSIQNDKINGVLVRILTGPITMRSYLIQNFFAAMIPAAILCLILGFTGFILHGWYFDFALALSLIYIMLSASSIGLSFAWSCLFKSKEASAAMFTMLISLISFVGGFMIPLSMLPDVLYYGGALFPAHWASRGINNLLIYGVDFDYWLSILAMFLFTVAFLLFGGKRRLI